MDEAEAARVIDAAIRRTAESCVIGRKVPLLIVQCRVQAEAARRLQALHRAGLVGRYTMPSVTIDPGGRSFTTHSNFDYLGGEA